MPNEYLRMQNFFAPEKQQFRSVFENTPVLNAAPVQSRQPSWTPPQPTQEEVPGPYDYDYSQEEEYPTPAMDAFTESVLNPPERTGPSKMRMLGTGLLSALQGSTGPESRVPVYNEKGKVIGSREAGFWESLGNKPFNVAQANAILDMPYDAAVEDYKLKTEAQQKAANIEKTAESNRALAEQRRATAAGVPGTVAARQQQATAATMRAEAGLMNAETARFINDMPKSEQFKLLQEGKISLAEINNAAAMERTRAQQAGATERTGMQQAGATERTGMQQSGALERSQIAAAAALERAAQGGAQIGTIPDPSDPTKQIGVWYNPRTQQMERVQLEGQGVGPVTKPGTKPTGGETPQEVARLQNVRTQAQEAKDLISELVDEKGKLRPEIQQAVGMSSWANFVPGTDAYTAAQKIKSLKDKLTLGVIGEMKAQSRTGATGFGQMNIKELGVLESAASIINTGVKEEAMEKELGRVIEKLDKVLQPGQQIEVAKPSEKGIGTTNTGGQRRTPQQIIEDARKRRQGTVVR